MQVAEAEGVISGCSLHALACRTACLRLNLGDVAPKPLLNAEALGTAGL